MTNSSIDNTMTTPSLREGSFFFEEHDLYCEGIRIKDIKVSTPCFIYSRQQLLNNISKYKEAFPSNTIIGFSLKSNFNPHLLKLIHDQGLSVVTVSGYEVQLALNTGFSGDQIFYNGVGKQEWEVRLAINNNCFLNVDSLFDAEMISNVATHLDKRVNVLIRIKPPSSAEVHPFLNTGQDSKFGISLSDLSEVINLLNRNSLITIVGVHVHVGSTVKDISVYKEVHRFITELIDQNKTDLRDARMIDLGGGLAIDYHHDGDAPTPAHLAEVLDDELRNSEYKLVLEPGRSITASSCILLCTVLGIKDGDDGDVSYAVVDAAMTELIRPALYGAHHHVVACHQRPGDDLVKYHVVGPVCESADIIAANVDLPKLQKGSSLFLPHQLMTKII